MILKYIIFPLSLIAGLCLILILIKDRNESKEIIILAPMSEQDYSQKGNEHFLSAVLAASSKKYRDQRIKVSAIDTRGLSNSTRTNNTYITRLEDKIKASNVKGIIGVQRSSVLRYLIDTDLCDFLNDQKLPFSIVGASINNIELNFSKKPKCTEVISRIYPQNEEFAKKAIEHISGLLNHEECIAVSTTSQYSADLVKSFQKEFQREFQSNCDSIFHNHTFDDKDNPLIKGGISIFFAGSYTQALGFLNKFPEDPGGNINVLLSDGALTKDLFLSNEVERIVHKGVQVKIITPFRGDLKNLQSFIEEYSKQYDSTPDGYGYFTYLATKKILSPESQVGNNPTDELMVCNINGTDHPLKECN